MKINMNGEQLDTKTVKEINYLIDEGFMTPEAATIDSGVPCGIAKMEPGLKNEYFGALNDFAPKFNKLCREMRHGWHQAKPGAFVFVPYIDGGFILGMMNCRAGNLKTGLVGTCSYVILTDIESFKTNFDDQTDIPVTMSLHAAYTMRSYSQGENLANDILIKDVKTMQKALNPNNGFGK